MPITRHFRNNHHTVFRCGSMSVCVCVCVSHNIIDLPSSPLSHHFSLSLYLSLSSLQQRTLQEPRCAVTDSRDGIMNYAEINTQKYYTLSLQSERRSYVRGIECWVSECCESVLASSASSESASVIGLCLF